MGAKEQQRTNKPTNQQTENRKSQLIYRLVTHFLLSEAVSRDNSSVPQLIADGVIISDGANTRVHAASWTTLETLDKYSTRTTEMATFGKAFAAFFRTLGGKYIGANVAHILLVKNNKRRPRRGLLPPRIKLRGVVVLSHVK